MGKSKYGFVALETIAIALLVILVLIVISVLTFSSFNKTPSSSSSPDSEKFQDKVSELQSENKYSILSTKDLFAKEFDGIPFNERLFYETQVHYAPFVKSSPTTSGNFQGKILSVSHENGLRIRMLGLLKSVEGKEVEFYYKPSALSSINVTYGTVNDLKIGDNINVDETNDVTKEYEESIVSVEISKIEK